VEGWILIKLRIKEQYLTELEKRVDNQIKARDDLPNFTLYGVSDVEAVGAANQGSQRQE